MARWPGAAAALVAVLATLVPNTLHSGDFIMAVASGPTPFVLEFTSAGGPQLGEGLTERRWALRIDGAAGTAELNTVRSDADTAGQPIGLFRNRLTAADLQQLPTLVDQVRLAEIPAGTGGGPGTSAMELRFEGGGRVIHKALTSGDRALMERLDPLISRLTTILGALFAHPVRAIRVDVTSVEGRFRLTVTNIGAEPLSLNDPRAFPPSHLDRWAGVRVAEYPPERPGVTAPPLRWSRVSLAPPPRTAAPFAPIVLEPGKTFTADTVAWKPTTPGLRHLAQAIFSDYEGPPTLAGIPHVRGAAFSNGLEFVPR